MEKTRKGFDFRMSKKVAELTQVVHMLFTRNHEKEVEIEALKEAYEEEISVVLEDAHNRIGELEYTIKELDSSLERERKGYDEKIKTAVEHEISSREDDWKKQLQSSTKQLAEEKTECQNLRDLLINAQRDIEKLRQGVTEQLTIKSDEIQKRDRELEKLRRQNMHLEKLLKDNEKQSNELIRDLEKNNDKLEHELTQLQELLEETHRAKEYLGTRNKQLENDLKILRKDFSKKVSEVVQSQQNHTQSKLVRSVPNFTDYNDELERLRKEVQRYRLELSNRDWNFNRMFTEKQPLVIDPKAGKIGIQSGQIIRGQSPQIEPMGRERSFSYAFVHSYEDESKRPNSSLSSVSSTRKLPELNADHKARLAKLMKPRPLPKEMLFGK